MEEKNIIEDPGKVNLSHIRIKNKVFSPFGEKMCLWFNEISNLVEVVSWLHPLVMGHPGKFLITRSLNSINIHSNLGYLSLCEILGIAKNRESFKILNYELDIIDFRSILDCGFEIKTNISELREQLNKMNILEVMHMTEEIVIPFKFVQNLTTEGLNMRFSAEEDIDQLRQQVKIDKLSGKLTE